MTRKMLRSFSFAVVVLTSATFFQQTALAGPPLICHPIDVGNARSLPWGAGSEWRAVKSDYDINRLVEDTLALLTPETPVLARMETLRRATVYAVWAKHDREVGITVKDQKIADELLARLMDRVRKSVGNIKSSSLALFDAGYLVACYRQAAYHSNTSPTSKLEGYTMVRKATGMSGGNAEMEFAAAMISKHPLQSAHREHLQKAIAGAKDGSLLARNLVKHFGQRGQNLADLRAQVISAKN
jgi:hypothetical protein